MLPSWIILSLVQGPALVFAELHKSLASHFYSLPRVPAGWLSHPKNPFPSQLGTTTGIITGHLIPLSRSLRKIINSFGPNTGPWGALLVRGCQLEKEMFTIPIWGPRSRAPLTPQTSCPRSSHVGVSGRKHGKHWKIQLDRIHYPSHMN